MLKAKKGKYLEKKKTTRRRGGKGGER